MQPSAAASQAPDQILCKWIREGRRSRVPMADGALLKFKFNFSYCGKSSGILVWSGFAGFLESAKKKKAANTGSDGGDVCRQRVYFCRCEPCFDGGIGNKPS